MAFLFGTGTLEIDNVAIPVQNISFEMSAESIPLYTNMSFPVAVATGKKSVKGSFTVGEINSALIAAIDNAIMQTAATETLLTWAALDTAGVTHTFGFPNITLTNKKFNAGTDKWLTMDVSFEAAASATGDHVMTYSGGGQT